MVSRPTSVGGLGFGMKWMMGWMHDTLEYFQKIRCIESTIKMNWLFLQLMLFRKFYVAPSHDEVVHGKNLYQEECLAMNGKICEFKIAIWLYVYASWN
jgi:1,4-alpha-glucan branching enzyme